MMLARILDRLGYALAYAAGVRDGARRAIAAERAAVSDYADRRCASVRAVAARGQINEEEADILCSRLRAFAGEVKAGLHLSDEIDSQGD